MTSHKLSCKEDEELLDDILDYMSKEFEVIGDKSSGFAFLHRELGEDFQLWWSNLFRGAETIVYHENGPHLGPGGDSFVRFCDVTELYDDFAVFIAEGIKHNIELFDLSHNKAYWELVIHRPEGSELWERMLRRCTSRKDHWDACIPPGHRHRIERAYFLLDDGNDSIYLLDCGAKGLYGFWFGTS